MKTDACAAPSRGAFPPPETAENFLLGNVIITEKLNFACQKLAAAHGMERREKEARKAAAVI